MNRAAQRQEPERSGFRYSSEIGFCGEVRFGSRIEDEELPIVLAGNARGTLPSSSKIAPKDPL
jgi:hypothetical protein